MKGFRIDDGGLPNLSLVVGTREGNRAPNIIKVRYIIINFVILCLHKEKFFEYFVNLFQQKKEKDKS